MKSIGIIAEYNPFHTGHKWQIAELRRRFGEDAGIVCVMSGNFVQRGEFAIVRKHIRAAAAIHGGADLVLELPLPWAISSAEGFGRGGVEVLDATGVVDTLAFGSECADTPRMVRIARALRTTAFAAALKEELKKGDSFAAARQRAAETVMGEDASVLGSPNDILGVEYQKALQELGSGIEPLALSRVGAAHDGGAADGYASASYIRKSILTGEPPSAYLTPDMRRLYEEERIVGRAPVHIDTAERAMLVKLRTMSEADYFSYDDGGEGLYHRFYAASRTSASLHSLLGAVSTKRYAYARLKRMAIAMYLGVKPSDRPEHVPYLRVLAMNGRGKNILHEMRAKAKLPVLVKPADVRKLSKCARDLMEQEARSSDLYALAYPDLSQSVGGCEWTTDPVIIDD